MSKEFSDKFDEIFENDENWKIRESLALGCLADFRLYIQTLFFAINRRPFTFKPFHNTIIQKLQNIADGKNTKKHLMLNLPVGSGKSLLTELFITWCFARNINAKFCYVSHSDGLINKLSRETKEIIECPEWFKLFKHSIKKDEKSKTQYSFEGSGTRTGLSASAMGSAITGVDAGNPNVEEDEFTGALIIDDPLDVGNANSETMKEECVRIFTDKLKTRLRTNRTPVIVIAQRIAVDDLPAYILEKEGQDFDVVTIKAYENGESYWPEKISAQELERMSRENPVLFNSQYQQDPIIAGGNLFKEEMFEFDVLPSRFDYTFITADTAYKEKQENDYTVFVHWGVKDNIAYIIDILRGKMRASDIEAWALPLCRRASVYGFRGCLIEPKGHGIYLNQRFPELGVMMPPQSYIEEFYKDRRQDKVMRANAVMPYLAYNKVYINETIDNTLKTEIMAELLNFPKAKHDDFVDCVIDGVKYVHTNSVSILDVL